MDGYTTTTMSGGGTASTASLKGLFVYVDVLTRFAIKRYHSILVASALQGVS